MQDATHIIPKIVAFEWDEGNDTKNSVKHQVTRREAEEVFLKEPLILSPDVKHSQAEKRYHGLGRTDTNRLLFVAFTIRNNKIRVISAHNQTKEKGAFMNQLKPLPDFKNEAEEREFWETHSSTDYIDWSKAKKHVFPDLKPSTKTISLRLPEELILRAKKQANRMDIPYQSLLKQKLYQSFDMQK